MNKLNNKRNLTTKALYIVYFVLMNITVSAKENEFNKIAEWHGYSQFRLTTNLNNDNNFTLQRLKFWIQSGPDFSSHWGFKVQTTLSGSKNEQFFLQDVYVFYRKKQFRINLGQFVPEYSLQWFQPDYTILLPDRSPVINTLIPDGTLGARDLGAQLEWQSTNQKIHSWIGLFNGYGIKQYKLNNAGFLITQKMQYEPYNDLKFGYSVMYRKADQLNLKNVLPDSVNFSGNDFRYDLFAQYHTRMFQFQAEYLSAFLNHSHAEGYNLLTALNLQKNQIVASWNQYNDIINSTEDAPVVHIGYNYLFNKDRMKLMADNSFQIKGNKLTGDILVLQFQLFFR